MHRIAAVLKLLSQLNKFSSNNLIRHEFQNGIRGGCFFILFDGYALSRKTVHRTVFFSLAFKSGPRLAGNIIESGSILKEYSLIQWCR